MMFYFAPMDGITEYTFRNIYNRHFPGIDKFFAPFIQPNDKPLIVPKEFIEINPENNKNINMVPQILTCDSDGFIKVGKQLAEYGYKEINLNAGCPSKVIVSKGKGSGLLKDIYKLEKFLDGIFSYDWNIDISVKTRLGIDEYDDFFDILEVYSKFPISELIVHPRYRNDFYNGNPRNDEFDKISQFDAFINGKIKICYNGNIFSKKDINQIFTKYRYISNIMIGRGLLSNPALVREIKGGMAMSCSEFIDYHNDLFYEYSLICNNERILLFRMKELWQYWKNIIDDENNIYDSIKTSNDINEYLTQVTKLFDFIKIKS